MWNIAITEEGVRIDDNFIIIIIIVDVDDNITASIAIARLLEVIDGI